MKHQPVLLKEILSCAKEIKSLTLALDATFGRGGHSSALKKKFPQMHLTAFDQDRAAVEWGKKHFHNIQVQHFNFHNFNKNSFQHKWDFILLDLGPSSPQLDSPDRGFSFYKEGPLDMRMDQQNSVTAETLINQLSAEHLFQLFKEKGEVRNPRPVVQSIVRERSKSPIQTTQRLAQLIEKKSSWKNHHRHPASKYFLALRIEVNNELEGLKHALPQMLPALSSGGRICILTFHSLEDRIVKRILKQAAATGHGVLVNKKTIKPSREEIALNPRSRSAQMRVFQNL